MTVPRKEVWRYLGYTGNNKDEPTAQLIEECIEELEEACTPKSTSKEFFLTLKDKNRISFATIEVESKNLFKNLERCERIIVFAATLGVQADFLIKKYSKIQMSKAVVMQAASAAMIEEYCDEKQEELVRKKQQEGFYLRPRFSPGYGDFDIKSQKTFIQLLECPKKIGLSVTDSLILAPSKSVTAVIGLTREPQNCHKNGCEQCSKLDCPFRRS